jgi:HAD superfamily hydrolase (TIGR01509 family)
VRDYQFVIFDYDGCLADSTKPWIDAMKQASAEFGITLTKDDILAQFSEIEIVVQQGLPEDKVMQYKARVIELATPKVRISPLYEGAKELLEALKAEKKKLAIVSGNQSGLEAPLKASGIRDYFDVVVTGNDVQSKKPDPEGVELALQKLGAEKRRSVMIGDTEHDLGAAKNAGIDSIFFCHPDRVLSYDNETIKNCRPTYTVSSHAELQKLLTGSKQVATV